MEKVGFIYKLVDNTSGNQYYGSTTQRVAQRVTGHRWNLKMHDEKRCTSYNILKNGDWRYETVEKFTYNDKFELRNREQYYIENNECVNKQRAYNSPEYNIQRAKEYREAHKEESRQYKREYGEAHKEETNQYKKEWYEKQKERILESRKEAYKVNKASLKRYHEKKAELNAKVTCECGAIVNGQNLKAHQQTKKHKNLIS